MFKARDKVRYKYTPSKYNNQICIIVDTVIGYDMSIYYRIKFKDSCMFRVDPSTLNYLNVSKDKLGKIYESNLYRRT